MSEGGGEALGPPYASTGGFQTSQPPTPSSTVPDSAADPNSKASFASGLPPFSSFTATDLITEGIGARLGPEGYGTEVYTHNISGWGYFDEGLSGRLMDRGDGVPMLVPQTQYTRPWESKPIETISQDGFTKTYEYPGSPVNKLPSFQSQFNSFPEQNGETISLTTLTPAPPSPTANNSGLPSFHTLSTVAVNPRSYPLVPAPMQAREIPHIQQQFLDERHIQLFQSPATLNNAQYHQLGLAPANPPGIIQGNFVTHPQPPQQATLLTVVKTEPVAIVTTQLHQQPNIYANSNSVMDHESVKMEENSSSPRVIQDSRKKERRKPRASSIETSCESDGVGNSSVESSGQVAAISSTANFKSPLMQHQNMSAMGGNMSVNSQNGEEDCENGTGEKQTKKKRKRCGECIGCQRKDNCGECAPCRNDKSHQICKMRRCEKLTDKKHLLYMQNEFNRTESRRGRGKGTRASYRNKGGRGGSNSNQNQGGPATPQQTPASGAVTPQPATHPPGGNAILSLNGSDPSPNPSMMTTTDHSPGSVMPFYNSNIPSGGVAEATSGFPPVVREHRFPNAVWQQTSGPAEAGAIGTWTPQGQFIQQLPPPQIDDIRYHTQYPAAAPVTVSSYTQSPSGYQPAQANFLQTNGPSYQNSQAPAASPLMNGGNTPRPNTIVNGNIDYVEASPRPTEYLNGSYPGQENSLLSQPPSTPNSRCSSVQNLDSNTSDSTVGVIAPSKTPTSVGNYIQPIGTPSQVTNQGNVMPGYPPQQPPQSQQSLHNSSGYPGDKPQSVPYRFTLEDGKPPTFLVKQDKDWSSYESIPNTQTTTDAWTPVSLPNGEKLNSPGYQSLAEERAIVNNRLKKHILEKKHANQPHFPQMQQMDFPNEDGQFAQPRRNQQFWAPTPPPQSPIQTQSHRSVQNSPSNLPQSSQHFHCSGQSMPPPASNPQANDEVRQQQSAHLHEQKMNSPEQMQQQQMHQHQQRQMQQQKQQFQHQMQQLHQQQAQEDQHQQLKHQMEQQQPQTAMQQHQQRMQQQQEQQQQQMTHQYQQQQLQHQQQVQQQQLQQHQMHQQQQQQQQGSSPEMFYNNQQNNISPQNQQMQQQQGSSPKMFYNNQQNNISPQNQQIQQQQQQQKLYLDEFSNKNQGNSHNFLMQGHHPQNLATEGGGFWNFSTAEENRNFQYSGQNQYQTTISQNELPSPCHTSAQPSGEGISNYNHVAKDKTSEMPMSSNALYTSSDFFANTVPTNQTNLGLAEDTGTKSGPKVPDEVQKLKENTKPAAPLCDCEIDGKPVDCGVYYSHLGAAANLPELRQDLESRIGFSGGAIRIEKIRYTGKEGKTAKGCPMAKWIIRRVSLDEKILVVVKHRPGHQCQTAWIIVLLVVWEGVPQEESNKLYSMLVPKLHKYGRLNNERRCATDELKTCACQGIDPRKAGASFSFGCSWSMFYNGCKFAKSKDIRKFRLIDGAEEAEMEKGLLALVSRVTPMFKKMHPIAYRNMTLLESDEIKCRLDCEEGRAFSGVTACVDFCSHAHRDLNNMNNGLTCVVSLSRYRGLSKPDDEQLHVLPLYTIDDTDEFGSREGQEMKTKTGAVEVLTKFESEVRVRFVPKKSCRRKRKEEESDCESLSSGWSPSPRGRRPRASSIASDASHVFDGQVQSSQISSTVVDNQGFRGWNYNSPNVDEVNWNDAETRRYTQAYTRMHLTPPPQSFSPLTTHSRTPNSMSSTHATMFSSPIGSEDWSPASNITDNTWDYNSSPQQTPSPYLVNRQPTPNLMSPSVDSFQSGNQDFLKPLPPDAATIKRDLLDDFKQVGKPVLTRRKKSDKVSVGINTTPVMFPPQFEDKGTSVDSSFFAAPSPETRMWPGIHDIILSPDMNSSPSTPPSPFRPPLRFNPTTLCADPRQTNTEDKSPCYPSPTCQNSQPQSPFVPVIPESPKLDLVGEVVEITKNEECFEDPQIGGVAIALGHGSVLFECAKHELHATTALRNPDKSHPSRISLVFYQHRNLNLPNHGIEVWAKRLEEKQRLKDLETAPKASSSKTVK